jgi:mRNA interferase RelE/StbE
MAYSVELLPSAAKALRKMDPTVRRRILHRLEALGAEPRPADVKRLQGPNDQWRIRVGDWRIIYRIEDERLLVLVVRIGHRSSVYD